MVTSAACVCKNEKINVTDKNNEKIVECNRIILIKGLKKGIK